MKTGANRLKNKMIFHPGNIPHRFKTEVFGKEDFGVYSAFTKGSDFVDFLLNIWHNLAV